AWGRSNLRHPMSTGINHENPSCHGKLVSGADAPDFAPALLSLQESPPSRMPRMVLHLVLTLSAILFLWTLLARLDIVASCEGKLVPQSFLKIVQPADSGIVEEILVREGQEVAAGQVLMRMDAKLAQADAAT